MSDLPPPPSIPELLVEAAQSSRKMNSELLAAAWLQTAPLVRFLKQLPYEAKVLECGAGGGTTAQFREWLNPARPDIKLYALDLNYSPGFDIYDKWQAIDYASPDAFPGETFDAICSANFVEHIPNGIYALAPWAKSRLNAGGQLFVQGPSANMKALNHTKEYTDAGLTTSTMHFYDDSTHLDTHTLEEMRDAIAEAGFLVEESGFWRNRFVEDEMLRQGYAQKEPTLTTYSIWLRSYVMQYTTAVLL